MLENIEMLAIDIYFWYIDISYCNTVLTVWMIKKIKIILAVAIKQILFFTYLNWLHSAICAKMCD